MLIAGVYGATRPLLPREEVPPWKADFGEEIMLEELDMPAAAAESEPVQTPSIEESDLEIPPLPVIEQPIQPPEMVEITSLESPPPAPPPPRSPAPRPQPTVSRSPIPASSRTSAGGAVGGGATLFTGGGAGRFPSPSYPASARSARQQGTVRLLVTVEASGIPSSVEVQSPSGFSVLDNAARDQVGRRWRWPAGGVRRYIVPVRFVLQ